MTSHSPELIPRHFWLDVALWALTTGLATWIILTYAFREPIVGTSGAAVAAAVGGLALLTGCLLRQRHTAVALAVSTAALLLLAYPASAARLSGWFAVPAALILWSAGCAVQSRLLRVLAAAAACAASLTVACGYAVNGHPSRRAFVVALGLCALAWCAGAVMRRRRRGQELAAERDRQQAVQEERVRIARDMHDVVAHSLAVIAAQAEGGRVAAVHAPERTAQSFETISSTARSSLDELRALLGVLRTDGSDSLASPPTLNDLPSLVSATRETGIDIRFTESGLPRPDMLSSAAHGALYRGAQEMLANAVKHGSGEAIELDLDWSTDSVMLSCTNSEGARTEAAGFGLRGLQERAALLGGEFTSGSDQGRFIARFVLPIDMHGHGDHGHGGAA